MVDKLSNFSEDWEKKIQELENIGTKWVSDLEKLTIDLESVVYDLTHLEVEIRIEGETDPIRRTEINLITGDISVTLPKGKILDDVDIEKINIEAIKLAREELSDRIDKLVNVIEILVKTLVPGGSLISIIEVINSALKIDDH